MSLYRGWKEKREMVERERERERERENEWGGVKRGRGRIDKRHSHTYRPH